MCQLGSWQGRICLTGFPCENGPCEVVGVGPQHPCCCWVSQPGSLSATSLCVPTSATACPHPAAVDSHYSVVAVVDPVVAVCHRLGSHCFVLISAAVCQLQTDCSVVTSCQILVVSAVPSLARPDCLPGPHPLPPL